MSSPTGLALRLIGPLIQLLCFVLLQKFGGQGRTVLGVDLEYWLYGGFGVGLVLVLLGITVFRTRHEPSAKMVEDDR